MPFSPRMRWPYPAEGQDPWYDSFEAFVKSTDQSGYASREDRQIFVTGGGKFCWNAGSSILSWDGTIKLTAAITGFVWEIAPGAVTLTDGQVVYFDLVRAPTKNITLTAQVASRVVNTDSAWMFAVRVGDRVYHREGKVLENGLCLRLYEAADLGYQVEIVPTPKTMIGDVPVNMGHVYLRAGDFDVRAFVGVIDPLLVFQYTLKLRRESDSFVVLMVGPSIDSPKEVITTLTLAQAGQYYLTLETDDPTGVALCSGILFASAV